MDKNILKILEGVGDSGILEKLPYGEKLVKLLNNYIDDAENKLTTESTGSDAIKAVKAMPSESMLQLMSLNLNVELALDNNWLEMQTMLNASDDKGKSTRPIAAILMAVSVFIFVCSYSVAMVIIALNDSTLPAWMELTAAVGVPSLVLTAYFGKRTLDKANRINASLGLPPKTSLTDLLAKKAGLIK